MKEKKEKAENIDREVGKMGRGNECDMPISVEQFGKERKNG